ncbi:MAG: ribulose 1,5-bisphosphate carboxylase [Alphaproteobacteria bacterium]|nr:ribulose 1,5-bisphosphate carboxylase [Alphaproteobacteria bacterium]
MSRFNVTYKIFADNDKHALSRAENIALEQTVEIPRDIVPKGYIEDNILGKLEDITRADNQSFNAQISYSPDSVGSELPQLLNVIFGNSGIQKGLKVIDLELGDVLSQRFTGAKFGIDGVRKKIGRSSGALIAAVIKPQGSSVDELALIAYRCALAGADIIKDDHGLTNQHMAPFKERVEKICEAVAKANLETGLNCLYFPNIAGHSADLERYAEFAKNSGGGGVLVMPGLFGFDAALRLARDDDFNLPIMTHPSFLGPYILSEDTGFSHAMMFGKIQRLCGADISVFPNVGGRFGFSELECRSIAIACKSDDGIGKPIMPSPGGGMTKERAADLKTMYGDDVVLLLGGSLLRYGDKIGDGIKEMRTALDAV